MLQRKRGSELGIGDFRLRTPRNEKLGGPRGLVDHGRGQARSSAPRAPTVRRCGACIDLEEFSKLRIIEAWHAVASLCIT